MIPETQRIAIAEACGWERREPDNLYPEVRWIDPQNKTQWRADYAVKDTGLPDFLNDLNAMHEAEKVLPAEKNGEYATQLQKLCDPYNSRPPHIASFSWHATAAQRSEAFLRTLGLWTE